MFIQSFCSVLVGTRIFWQEMLLRPDLTLDGIVFELMRLL
jgi:hypothetical protein